MTRAFTAAIALVLASASLAHAQDRAATPPPAPPPTPTLVLEQIHDGVVVAPEYKITELDGDVGQLIGAHVGRQFDGVLFIGGAGYWLANGSHDFELAYGGLLIGWSTPADRRISFGARALVGGGSATLGTTLTGAVAVRFQDGRGGSLARFGGGRGGFTVPQPGVPAARTIRYIARDDFFVTEPAVDITTRLTEHVGVEVSGGYRWTQFNDVLGDRLDGVTGSLAIQLGW
jgi:hypothetical protein